MTANLEMIKEAREILEGNIEKTPIYTASRMNILLPSKKGPRQPEPENTRIKFIPWSFKSQGSSL